MNSLQTLLSKFDKRWLGAGVAAAGAAVASQATEAAIVYVPGANINIPSTTAGVYLNVVTGVHNSNPALVPGWDVNPWSSSGLSYFSPTGQGFTGAYVQRSGGGATGNLPVGTGISATPGGGRPYGSSAAATTGSDPHLLQSDQNCIGFRFRNENTQAIHYGWMRISLASTLAGQPRTIVEYAYEDVPGAPIGACVPEPSSLALLALGAVGLIRRRK